jgi:hypothetical protein
MIVLETFNYFYNNLLKVGSKVQVKRSFELPMHFWDVTGTVIGRYMGVSIVKFDHPIFDEGENKDIHKYAFADEQLSTNIKK